MTSWQLYSYYTPVLGLGAQVHQLLRVFALPIFHVPQECVYLPLYPQVEDFLQRLLAGGPNLLPQRTLGCTFWLCVGVQVWDHPGFQGQRGLGHLELLEVVFHERDGLRQHEGEQPHEAFLVIVEADEFVWVLVVFFNFCIDDGNVHQSPRIDDLTPLLPPHERIWPWPIHEDLFGGHGLLQLTLSIPGRWVIDGLDLEQSAYLRQTCNDGCLTHRPSLPESDNGLQNHSNSAEFAHANVNDHGPINDLLACDRGRAEEDMNGVLPRAVWFQEEAVGGVTDVTHFGLAFDVVVLSKPNLPWG